MKRNIIQALTNATQMTLEQWSQKLKEAIQSKEQVKATYEAKKQKLLPQLLEAHEKGISLRELAKITGISFSTISRWLKTAEQKEDRTDGDNSRPT